MSRRDQFTIAAVTAAAGAALVFLFSHRPPNETPAPSPALAGGPTVSGDTAARAHPAPAELPRIIRADLEPEDPGSRDEDSQSGELSASDRYYEESTLGDILQELTEGDATLAQLAYFREHVLLDADGRRRYEEMLADRSVYAEVSHDLLFPEAKRETLRGNVGRLMKLDYLREALEWEENPQREALLDVIQSTLLTDCFPADMTTDMKLSLSGNKMELYALLYDHAPNRAAEAVELSRGTRLEPLITFIAGSIQDRRARELTAESQVTL